MIKMDIRKDFEKAFLQVQNTFCDNPLSGVNICNSLA
jgi:hypothetical protein